MCGHQSMARACENFKNFLEILFNREFEKPENWKYFHLCWMSSKLTSGFCMRQAGNSCQLFSPSLLLQTKLNISLVMIFVVFVCKTQKRLHFQTIAGILISSDKSSLCHYVPLLILRRKKTTKNERQQTEGGMIGTYMVDKTGPKKGKETQGALSKEEWTCLYTWQMPYPFSLYKL